MQTSEPSVRKEKVWKLENNRESIYISYFRHMDNMPYS